MGAETFVQEGKGKSAKEAFLAAREEACYWNGHGGYTGTLAEKETFVMIPLPEDKDPDRYAEELLASDDPRIDDKWGPAGCFDLGDEKYLFFGWASS